MTLGSLGTNQPGGRGVMLIMGGEGDPGDPGDPITKVGVGCSDPGVSGDTRDPGVIGDPVVTPNKRATDTKTGHNTTFELISAIKTLR